MLLYTVSRCRKKAYKWEIYPSFETQGRHHQKYKTGLLVFPQKGVVSYKIKKKVLASLPCGTKPHTRTQQMSGTPLTGFVSSGSLVLETFFFCGNIILLQWISGLSASKVHNNVYAQKTQDCIKKIGSTTHFLFQLKENPYWFWAKITLQEG